MNPRRVKVRQILALLVALAMTVTQTLTPGAGEALTASGTQLSGINLTEMTIPEKLGSIEEIHEGKSQKLVVFIQDAHANYEAQRHITEILEHLAAEYEIKLIGMEGAEGPVDLSLYRALPRPEVMERILDADMKLGQTQGVEFFAMTTAQPVELLGVDNDRLYLENLEQYAQIVGEKDTHLPYLRKFQQRLNNLKGVLFSEDARTLDRLVYRYGKDEVDIQTLLHQMMPLSEKAGIDTRTFPAVYRLSTLMTGADPAEPDQATDVKALAGQIEPKRLMKELDRFKEDVQLALAATPEEKTLVRLGRYFHLLEDGLELALTREMLEELNGLRAEFPEKSVRGFLGLMLSKTFIKQGRIEARKRENLDDLADAIADFYATVTGRDTTMVDRLLRHMTEYRKPHGILVAGGFHTTGITKKLRQKGYSYAVIQPRVSAVTDSDTYRSLMLDWGAIVAGESGVRTLPTIVRHSGVDTWHAARRLSGRIAEMNRRIWDQYSKEVLGEGGMTVDDFGRAVINNSGGRVFPLRSPDGSFALVFTLGGVRDAYALANGFGEDPADILPSTAAVFQLPNTADRFFAGFGAEKVVSAVPERSEGAKVSERIIEANARVVLDGKLSSALQVLLEHGTMGSVERERRQQLITKWSAELAALMEAKIINADQAERLIRSLRWGGKGVILIRSDEIKEFNTVRSLIVAHGEKVKPRLAAADTDDGLAIVKLAGWNFWDGITNASKSIQKTFDAIFNNVSSAILYSAAAAIGAAIVVLVHFGMGLSDATKLLRLLQPYLVSSLFVALLAAGASGIQKAINAVRYLRRETERLPELLLQTGMTTPNAVAEYESGGIRSFIDYQRAAGFGAEDKPTDRRAAARQAVSGLIPRLVVRMANFSASIPDALMQTRLRRRDVLAAAALGVTACIGCGATGGGGPGTVDGTDGSMDGGGDTDGMTPDEPALDASKFINTESYFSGRIGTLHGIAMDQRRPGESEPRDFTQPAVIAQQISNLAAVFAGGPSAYFTPESAELELKDIIERLIDFQIDMTETTEFAGLLPWMNITADGRLVRDRGTAGTQATFVDNIHLTMAMEAVRGAFLQAKPDSLVGRLAAAFIEGQEEGYRNLYDPGRGLMRFGIMSDGGYMGGWVDRLVQETAPGMAYLVAKFGINEEVLTNLYVDAQSRIARVTVNGEEIPFLKSFQGELAFTVGTWATLWDLNQWPMWKKIYENTARVVLGYMEENGLPAPPVPTTNPPTDYAVSGMPGPYAELDPERSDLVALYGLWLLAAQTEGELRDAYLAKINEWENQIGTLTIDGGEVSISAINAAMGAQSNVALGIDTGLSNTAKRGAAVPGLIEAAMRAGGRLNSMIALGRLAADYLSDALGGTEPPVIEGHTKQDYLDAVNALDLSFPIGRGEIDDLRIADADQILTAFLERLGYRIPVQGDFSFYAENIILRGEFGINTLAALKDNLERHLFSGDGVVTRKGVTQKTVLGAADLDAVFEAVSSRDFDFVLQNNNLTPEQGAEILEAVLDEFGWDISDADDFSFYAQNIIIRGDFGVDTLGKLVDVLKRHTLLEDSIVTDRPFLRLITPDKQIAQLKRSTPERVGSRVPSWVLGHFNVDWKSDPRRRALPDWVVSHYGAFDTSAMPLSNLAATGFGVARPRRNKLDEFQRDVLTQWEDRIAKLKTRNELFTVYQYALLQIAYNEAAHAVAFPIRRNDDALLETLADVISTAYVKSRFEIAGAGVFEAFEKDIPDMEDMITKAGMFLPRDAVLNTIQWFAESRILDRRHPFEMAKRDWSAHNRYREFVSDAMFDISASLNSMANEVASRAPADIGSLHSVVAAVLRVFNKGGFEDEAVVEIPDAPGFESTLDASAIGAGTAGFGAGSGTGGQAKILYEKLVRFHRDFARRNTGFDDVARLQMEYHERRRNDTNSVAPDGLGSLSVEEFALVQIFSQSVSDRLTFTALLEEIGRIESEMPAASASDQIAELQLRLNADVPLRIDRAAKVDEMAVWLAGILRDLELGSPIERSVTDTIELTATALEDILKPGPDSGDPHDGLEQLKSQLEAELDYRSGLNEILFFGFLELYDPRGMRNHESFILTAHALEKFEQAVISSSENLSTFLNRESARLLSERKRIPVEHLVRRFAEHFQVISKLETTEYDMDAYNEMVEELQFAKERTLDTLAESLEAGGFISEFDPIIAMSLAGLIANMAQLYSDDLAFFVRALDVNTKVRLFGLAAGEVARDMTVVWSEKLLNVGQRLVEVEGNDELGQKIVEIRKQMQAEQVAFMNTEDLVLNFAIHHAAAYDADGNLRPGDDNLRLANTAHLLMEELEQRRDAIAIVGAYFNRKYYGLIKMWDQHLWEDIGQFGGANYNIINIAHVIIAMSILVQRVSTVHRDDENTLNEAVLVADHMRDRVAEEYRFRHLFGPEVITQTANVAEAVASLINENRASRSKDDTGRGFGAQAAGVATAYFAAGFGVELAPVFHEGSLSRQRALEALAANPAKASRMKRLATDALLRALRRDGRLVVGWDERDILDRLKNETNDANILAAVDALPLEVVVTYNGNVDPSTAKLPPMLERRMPEEGREHRFLDVTAGAEQLKQQLQHIGFYGYEILLRYVVLDENLENLVAALHPEQQRRFNSERHNLGALISAYFLAEQAVSLSA